MALKPFLGPVLLTLPVFFLQGDRGYEGPKGSRGPPGIGYKGDKVWLTVRVTVKGLQTNVSCYDELTPHWSGPQGNTGAPGLPGLVGFPGPGIQGEKAGTIKMLQICFPYLTFIYVTT